MTADAPTVAVLGASADPAKYSNRSIRAHRQQGWQVFPVNPKGGTIEGLKVYRSLAEVPVERLRRISVYLPPDVLLGVLEEIAAKGAEEVFFNPGSDRPDVVEKARQLGLEPIQACSIIDVQSRGPAGPSG